MGERKSRPAPPPPPLPYIPLQESKLKPSELSEFDENQLENAVKRLCLSDSKFETFYMCNTNLKPQLQDGPKCGLVALSIATSLTKNFVKVDNIYQTAVLLGYTKQGEIFNVNSLALLAEKYNFKARILKGGLNTHLNCIMKSLFRKCLLLVPYDADFNHAPCCKQGTKAHWAVITGFVIIKQNGTTPSSENEDFVSISSLNCSAVCDCPNNSFDSSFPLTVCIYQGTAIIGKRLRKENCINKLKEGKIYLVGLQGKSCHLGLWLFDEMVKSNNNLVTLSSTRDSSYYVLPEGGLEEGLKGKAIILDPSPL